MDKKAFAQLDWITGEGHAAQTTTLPDVTGKCTRVDIVVSSVTGGPTVSVTITDTDDGGQYFTVSGKADGTHHILLGDSNKGSPDADFNPFALFGNNLTVSVDPSADAGGADQTLTVDVRLYLEEV